MAGVHLPEDIIVKIMSKLPVKSLIRFRCVSKRWRSRVSDPQFARLQFKVTCERQTISRRLLLSSDAGTSQFESLDLETTSFQANSSIRKLDLPFRPGSPVRLLCACNGLVCVALDANSFYIWNPSIGFTHRLPDSFYSSKRMLCHYGFGYVSATDDYKLLMVADAVVVDSLGVREEVQVVEMFSLRTRIWKKIEADPFDCIPESRGVLSNEALHWLNWVGHNYALAGLDSDDDEPAIIAFDLATEEFWEMPVPFIAKYNFRYAVLGVSCDGCLCVICSESKYLVSVEFWVMREYGKGDSWTKLYKLKTYNPPPKHIRSLNPIVVMQCSAVVMISTDSGLELVRCDHHEEKLGETSTVAARYMVPYGMVGYEESYGMVGYEESYFGLVIILGLKRRRSHPKGSKPNTRPHKAEIGGDSRIQVMVLECTVADLVCRPDEVGAIYDIQRTLFVADDCQRSVFS